MSHNWRNYDKIPKFSDANNTRKIDAFSSKQKSSETWEFEVDEQSENRPLSSDMGMTSYSKAKVGHLHQYPQPKNRLLMFLSLKFSFNHVYLH